MKDDCSDDARPDGNDCALPPVWNNTKGEYRQNDQQGDFDKGFHRQNMCPTVGRGNRVLAVARRQPGCARHAAETDSFQRPKSTL